MRLRLTDAAGDRRTHSGGHHDRGGGVERFSLDMGRLAVSNKRRECRFAAFSAPGQMSNLRAKENANHVDTLLLLPLLPLTLTLVVSG